MRARFALALAALVLGCVQAPCFCDDENPCTHDLCVDGVCVNKPLNGPVQDCFGGVGCIEYTCSGGSCLPQKVMGCCGDGECSPDESHMACPRDCAPSCVDGVRNQGEDDIDCGGPCDSCENQNINYLMRLGRLRTSWQDIVSNYTADVRSYNLHRNLSLMKAASFRYYSGSESIRTRLNRMQVPEDLHALHELMNHSLSLYLMAVHEMILYTSSGRQSNRLAANRLFADSVDSDKDFVSAYNGYVDKYNNLSRTCNNFLYDVGEESVDCGRLCSRACGQELNVTKYVRVTVEGAKTTVKLNVTPAALDFPPSQHVRATYFDPEPLKVHVSDEGNVYYYYEFHMPAYGVREIEVTESLVLRRMIPHTPSDSQYFSSTYQLVSEKTPLSEDICYRAKVIKDDVGDTQAIIKSLVEWIRQNVEYEPNREELGAEYCYRYRRGACDEQADLLIFMARCVGIPARRITGNLINASQLSGHAWAQYYDGGWIYVDPSTKRRDQAFALDNKHIISCIGEGAQECGVGYTYTYTGAKPKVEVEDKVYLS